MTLQSSSLLLRFNPLKRLWPYLRHYKRAMFWAVFSLFSSAAITLGIVSGLRFTVDHGLVLKNNFILDLSLVLLFAAIALLSIFTYIRYSSAAKMGEHIVSDLRTAVYAHILKLNPSFFEKRRTGDILSTFIADTAILQNGVSTSLSMIARNGFLLVGGIFMMILTSTKFSLFITIMIPLIVFPLIAFGRKTKRLSRKSQDNLGRFSTHTEETIHGIRTVQAFCHEGQDLSDFRKNNRSALDNAMERIHTRGLLIALIILLVFSGVGCILWVGGHNVIAGTMSSGQLISFLIYAVMAASSLANISETMGDLQKSAAAAERIFELLEIEPQITSPHNPIALPKTQGLLVFDKVSFYYPSRPETPALSNISFTLKPGERVAIIGPSGAGKSSIFQLILRFYDQAAGTISLHGIPTNEVSLEDLRTHIALVPQDPIIFSDNAFNNIAYGRPSASREEVLQAARLAHADEFIEKLPDGYDSYLGEKGAQLSIGQCQRIAIARAILRDPLILLLDEATSALDAGNQKLVHDGLEKLMHGRSTLIIAHQLATVTRADRILVIDNGTIIAQGTHGELIKQGGLYAHWVQLQNIQHDDARVIE